MDSLNSTIIRTLHFMHIKHNNYFTKEQVNQKGKNPSKLATIPINKQKRTQKSKKEKKISTLQHVDKSFTIKIYVDE